MLENMSIYSIVEKPLILTNLDRNNHLEKYAKQFTTNPCIVKTNFDIGTFSKHNLTSRPSTRAYLNYKHKINTQLTELNNNMSNLIRESVTGIDNLCNKVRDCLMDFEDSDRQKYIKKNKEREDFIDFDQPPNPQQILQQLQDCVVEKQCYESILEALIEDINMKIEKLIIPNEIQDENAIVVSIPDEIERKNSEKMEEKQPTVEKLPKELPEKENTEEICKNVLIERDTNRPPIQPEVYRKKATSNLHERLKKEIESNDSFLNFQKLMHDYQTKCEQKKKSKKPNDPNLLSKKLKMHSLTTKYKDSLWFSQQSPIIKRKKPRKIENKSIKRTKTPNFPSCTHLKLPDLEKMPKKKAYTSSCTIQLRNKSNRSSTTSLIRKKPDQINCLDDLTSRDLAPLHSEYPRRDNEGISHTNIKNTYLYKLLYSDQNNIWQKLFAKPNSSIPEESDEESDEKRAIRDKLRPHLIDPDKKSHPPLIVMPVRLYYNNPPTNQAKLPLVPIRETPPTVETLKVQLSLKKANKTPSTSSMKQVSSRNEMKPKSTKINVEKPLIPRLNLRPDTKKQKKAETVSLDRDKKKTVISRLTTPKKPATVRKLAIPEAKIKKPEIVSQLESLRDRNDVIQRNIQKAINVIEMKMIDILSTPSDTTNSDAFDAMEKEITNVLTVMKSDEKTQSFAEEKIQLKAHIEALNENVDELLAHSPKKLKTIVSDEEVPKNSARKRREKITKTQSTGIKEVSNTLKKKETPKKSTQIDGMESGDTKEDSKTVTTSKSKIKQQLDDNFSDCYKEITKNSEELKESYHELEKVATNLEEEKWSEQLHKILTKMENVYQDIEDSDNEDSNKSENQTTSPIKSEIFYTPFMQLLRELRKNTADVDEKIKEIQSSPSCYNVLSFLNTLTTDSREEEPPIPEIHTTKYCYYLHIEYEAIVEPVVTVTDWVRYLCSTDVIEHKTIEAPKKEACNQVNLIEQRHLPHNISKMVKSNTIQLNLIEERIRQNINELLQCNIVKKMFRNQNVKGNFNVDAVRVVEKFVEQNTERMTVIQDDVICLLRNILRETSALEVHEKRLASAAIMPMDCTDLDDYKQQRLIMLKYLYALIFIVMFGAFNINIRCPFL